MMINSVRVQNFRCIRDSGEIPLTPNLTIFIGENESGKTSLLDALECFNEGQEFHDADLSTMSPIRGDVLSGVIGRDTVDVVTITVKLSASEREQLNIPSNTLPDDTLRITKRFDNSYIIKGSNDTSLASQYASINNNRMLTEINVMHRQIRSVYQGRIVRKLPSDQFVFIRKSEDDPESEDLILFPNYAGDLWDGLNQGDVVQVTHQAPDPYGRNARAMNVGKLIDLDEELTAVQSVASTEGSELTSALKALLSKVRTIPYNHPLRGIFSDEFQNLLTEHIETSAEQIPWNDTSILAEVPNFEKGKASSVADRMPLSASDELMSDIEINGGLLALIDEVGLVPSEAVTAEPTERIRTFDEKSRLLSELFSKSWVRPVQAEFVPFNQDKELGLAIDCQGSLDPPSRRSQGFNSYLGLTSRLLELRKRAGHPLVLILDDPAMHLHPTAQDKLSSVLASQSFQVLVATHFPFMLSSDRLDRVRLMNRTETGAYFEEDWRRARNGLLPIRGAFSKWTLGKIPLLVEGQSDRSILMKISELLESQGKAYLSPLIEPLPSGGSSMPETAKALRAMDVKFIALVDGDRGGRDIQRKLIREVDQPETAIVSISDVIDDVIEPEVEHLFSQDIRNSSYWINGGLEASLEAMIGGRLVLDSESENNLLKLLVMLNETLSDLAASQ